MQLAMREAVPVPASAVASSWEQRGHVSSAKSPQRAAASWAGQEQQEGTALLCPAPGCGHCCPGKRRRASGSCSPPVSSSSPCYQPQTWDVCGLHLPTRIGRPCTECHQSSAEILSCWGAEAVMCCIHSFEDQVSQQKQESTRRASSIPDLIMALPRAQTPFPPGLSSHSTDHSS